MEIKIGDIIRIKGSNIIREVTEITDNGVTAIRVDRKSTYYGAYNIKPQKIEIVK